MSNSPPFCKFFLLELEPRRFFRFGSVPRKSLRFFGSMNTVLELLPPLIEGCRKISNEAGIGAQVEKSRGSENFSGWGGAFLEG